MRVLKVLRLLPFLLLLAALLGTGCGRQQYIVAITTNAPVPSWGDRVLVEVMKPDGSLACSDCRHEFDTTIDTMPFSFGLPFPGDLNVTSLRVRARLYHARDVGPDGVPPALAVIDAVSDTPTGPNLPFQTTKLYLILQAYCYGCPADVGAHTSCNVVLGGDDRFHCNAPEQAMYDQALISIDPFLPNVINDNAACRTAPADGRVCVPGEAFILGEARSIGVDTDYPATPTVPQFPGVPGEIDSDEMTVGRARPILAKLGVGPQDIWTHGQTGVPDACTYLGPKDSRNDALPLNCVSLAAAIEICNELGLFLPTEDEWESAAQNGSSDNRFPWGNEPPDCTRSIVSADATCLRTRPIAGGSPLDLTPRGVKNMGGNLSEWVDGPLVTYDNPCWTALGGLAADCTKGFNAWPGPWVHRGGSYGRRASSAATFARFASSNGSPDPQIGFRCGAAQPH
jgi:hypothetical protein